MKTLKTLHVLAFVLLTSYANAQIARNTKEAIDDRKAIRVDKHQLKKDVAQLATFKMKINAFENAFIKRNIGKAKSLKADILLDMQREIAQSERKIAQDKRELAQSKREARTSKRESRRSRRDVVALNNSKERRDLRKDSHDKRDDARDKRDDRRDLKAQIARTKRQKEIVKKIKVLSFSTKHGFRKNKMTANHKLLQEFVQTMEADITATKAELHEDRREVREDRRERREDRKI